MHWLVPLRFGDQTGDRPGPVLENLVGPDQLKDHFGPKPVKSDKALDKSRIYPNLHFWFWQPNTCGQDRSVSWNNFYQQTANLNNSYMYS